MLLIVIAVTVSFAVGLVAGWCAGVIVGSAKANAAWIDAVRLKFGTTAATEIANSVTVKAKIGEGL